MDAEQSLCVSVADLRNALRHVIGRKRRRQIIVQLSWDERAQLLVVGGVREGLCVFRAKPATDSDAKRPVIPTQAGH